MSGLDFKGNLIEMLGNYLPTPFIEYVRIEDNQVAVKLALYFEVEEKLETNSMGTMYGVGPPVYENLLAEEKLYVWLAQSVDREVIQQVLTKEMNIISLAMASHNDGDPGLIYIPYQELYTDTSYVLPTDAIENLANGGEGYGSMGIVRTRCYALSDFTYEDDYPNEERTKRIYKYSLTDLSSADNTLPYIAPGGWNSSVTDYRNYAELMPELPDAFQNLTLFSFCSTWNGTDPITQGWHVKNFSNTGFTAAQLADIADAIGDDSVLAKETPITSTYLPPVPPAILDKQISNISYEPIFASGEVVSPTIAAFVKTDGVIYRGIPMRALTGEYYTTDFLSHELLASDIKNLLIEFEQYYNSFPDLRNMMDAIVIAINTDPTGTNLLRELHQLRLLFPSQATTDPTGVLYRRFSKRIDRANRMLKQGTVVTKKLLSNPKVYDARQQEDMVLAASSAGAAQTFGYAVINTDDGNDQILYNEMLINRVLYDLDSLDSDGDGEAKAVYWGYYFIDIEKLIHGASQLSRIFNVPKVESLFGKQLTNAMIIPVKTRIKRTQDRYASSPLVYLDCVFDSSVGYPNALFSKYQEVAVTAPGDVSVWQQLKFDPSTGGASTELGYSHVTPRAFDTATSDGGLGNYRLMCMEFEDYRTVAIAGGEISGVALLDGASEPDEHYHLEFRYKDYSKVVIDAIIDNFTDALQLLEEYYEAASEACSYDAREDVEVFNQFFIEGMTRAYEEDPDNAPWLRCALIFYTHWDLLFNTYNGTTSLILTNAQNMSNQISPTTGTLDGIYDFLKQMRNFYADHYEPGAYNTAGTAIAGYDSESEIIVTTDVPYDQIPELYIPADLASTLAAAAAQEEAESALILRAWDLNSGFPRVAQDINHSPEDKGYEHDVWPYSQTPIVYDPVPFTYQSMENALIEPTGDAADGGGGGGWGGHFLDEFMRAELGYDLASKMAETNGVNDYVQQSSDGTQWFINPNTFEAVVKMLGEFVYSQDSVAFLETIAAPPCLSRTIYWDRRNAYRNGYGNALNKGFDNHKDSMMDATQSAASLLSRILYPNRTLIVDTFGLESKYSSGLANARGKYDNDDNPGFTKKGWLVSAWVCDLAFNTPGYYANESTNSGIANCKCSYDENTNYISAE